MRALTLRQPWAWAVCYGGKDVENRSWPFPHSVIQEQPVCVGCSGSGKRWRAAEPWATNGARAREKCLTCHGSGKQPPTIAIHAGTGWDGDPGRPGRRSQWATLPDGTRMMTWTNQFGDRVTSRARTGPSFRSPFGAIVAVATIAACCPIVDDPWDHEGYPRYIRVDPKTDIDGRSLMRTAAVAGPPIAASVWVDRSAAWVWELADVRPLAQPIPAKGRQGLWRVPADVETEIWAQLS